jgi:60 kDa SS-A/Ro ribonucleoprotein
MANKNLFQSIVGALIPATDACNEEHAPAYAFTPKQALAQYAATGCMSRTFYASAEEQLATVIALCAGIEASFVAKTAIYARSRGHMKDVPALLCAILSAADREMMEKVFPRVIDNGRMLRTFVQIVRSGVVGRKSFGTAPKRVIRRWLEARGDEALFNASVGQSPSLADIVKMVHPKPATDSRKALYGYLIGRACDANALPAVVKDFEAYKAGRREAVPDVPFQMLTALDLGRDAWAAIARNASWQMTRMNLNTFARHGVFDVEGMTDLIAARLSDKEQIAAARVFPYQLLAAFTSVDGAVPASVRDALQDAMEVAIGNVPVVEGKVFVCPDVSGSMRSPVTGARGSATTAMRCVDVAALVAAAVVRKNASAEVLPFETKVVNVAINRRDSVMTNAARLAAVGGGGTNCSAPVALLNDCEANGDLVILVSDNESWVDASRHRGTELMKQWNIFRKRNPTARLVCIDLQPYGTTQAAEREDILNVGGFSDAVFDVIARFAAGELGSNHWVDVIEAIEL